MMTRREAIEALKYLISGECTDTQMDYVDEIKMAITDMKICDANNAGWISVKDRLPEKAERYMCLCYDFVTKSYWHELLWYENNHWWTSLATLDHDYTKHVVYWMPLPEPPKEET